MYWNNTQVACRVRRRRGEIAVCSSVLAYQVLYPTRRGVQRPVVGSRLLKLYLSTQDINCSTHANAHDNSEQTSLASLSYHQRKHVRAFNFWGKHNISRNNQLPSLLPPTSLTSTTYRPTAASTTSPFPSVRITLISRPAYRIRYATLGKSKRSYKSTQTPRFCSKPCHSNSSLSRPCQ